MASLSMMNIFGLKGSYKGPLQKGLAGVYRNLLRSFGKRNINDVAFEKFKVGVSEHIKKSGQKVHTPFEDYDFFKELVKSGQVVYYESDYKNKTPIKIKKLDEAHIRSAYVQYWADKIITTHNQKVKRAATLSKGKYDFDPVDITTAEIRVQPGTNVGEVFGRVITQEELFKIGDDRLDIYANPDTYKIDRAVSLPNKKKIFDRRKTTLKDMGNLRDLFYHNLYKAVTDAGWDIAKGLIEDCINNGNADLIYDAYTESGVDIIFEYKERVGDSYLKSQEDVFVEVLRRLIAERAAEEQSEG